MGRLLLRLLLRARLFSCLYTRFYVLLHQKGVSLWEHDLKFVLCVDMECIWSV